MGLKVRIKLSIVLNWVKNKSYNDIYCYSNKKKYLKYIIILYKNFRNEKLY
jgi:hypothetical protein